MWILHKVFLKMTKISILQASALALFLIVFSSITMRAAEPETFPRFIDALWWTMTTLVTVGYGDYFPESDFGRIFTMLLLYTFGIGAMGIIIGKVFESFSMYRKWKEEGRLTYSGKGHYILIGASKEKLENVVEEILHSKQKCDVVIVDHSERTPMEHERVHFVSGNPAEEEVLMKANILEAKSVAIFSDDRNDHAEYSDGKTLLIASRVEHISKKYEKSIYTIVEIKKDKHVSLFEHANVDELILSNDSISRLMAHAAINHGSSKLFNQMLSSSEGENLYEIKAKPHWSTYRDAAMELFEIGATLISDGSSLDLARRHHELIPDSAKLFVICDETTYQKIIS
ncbi:MULTISPECIES: potassium channel family protein [Cytobacillus]|jgi:voltage-gated potassium channel|uniref:Ion transporter n=3 Tax=Bacillaceae TaxID=186817 RepID=A0A161IYU1_9BACI|nr:MULTISPECIES: potassium channel family protein [Cytobacillus]MBY0159501.1 potassium channel protein [Cytobacillus firmus]AND41905.1 ion transporter [Cytobacillus oceanisediminis 2691]MCM3244520.1 potassium channel family protein [Cytobacillus oceanisediminis]MCM3393706.1 potassium channel family protein [Cytobacillus oceanisediminis]MCM3529432.1 potassium channel family protein [Cytobacillus oceanisediminis]